MERSELLRRVWTELEPELGDMGFELIEVEFAKHGSTNVLRLFIDRDAGVAIDDCATASRLVSALLDKGDFIEMHYNLEVSSPGIARPIRKPDDFERFAGEAIKIKTETPVDGRKRFSGTLVGFDDGLVCIKCDDIDHRIHVENIKHANLDR